MGFLLLLLVPFALARQPAVELSQGRAVGVFEKTRGGRTISAFLGIPYAEPPVGKLRFEAPVTAGPWKGLLNATHPPPDCLQFSHVTYHFPYCPVTGLEDCLYLNVYTPKVFSEKDSFKGLLDVLVFIHPGSWMYFGANYQGPGILLDKDIILVTINHRLGPLGFLSTGDHVVPGNNGLKDQVLALTWVKENIMEFGGDPKRVTIAGMSSGGASVHYHMLSPLSKGLFSRAISASGTALNPWSLAEDVPAKTAKVASQLGCPTSSSGEMVLCLKTRPAHHIVKLSTLFMPWLYNPFSPYGPVVEPKGTLGAFITQKPLDLIKRGPLNDVPWLVTFTSEEGLYPAAEILGTESYIDHLEANWEKLMPFILDYNYTVPSKELSSVTWSIKSHYEIDLRSKEGKKNFVQLLTDRLYLEGISNSLKIHAKKSKFPVYAYRFSYSGQFSVADVLTKYTVKERHGVCHGDDIIYILPMPWFSVMTPSEADSKVSTLLRDIWVGFAQKGTASWSSIQKLYPDLIFADIKDADDMSTVQAPDLTDHHDFWQELPINEDKIVHNKDEL